MKRRMPREASCVLCENTEDLQEVAGRLVCRPCCVCTHEINAAQEACLICLRDLYTVWAFTGPCLVGVKEYLQTAKGLKMDVDNLLVWTYEEEMASIDQWYKKWNSIQVVEPLWPFPFPLLHHLKHQ